MEDGAEIKDPVNKEFERARCELNKRLSYLQYEIEQLVLAALTGSNRYVEVSPETIELRLERLRLFTEIISGIRVLIVSQSTMGGRELDKFLRALEKNLLRFKDTHTDSELP